MRRQFSTKRKKKKERDPFKKKSTPEQPSHRLRPRGPTPEMEGKGTSRRRRQEAGPGDLRATNPPARARPGCWRAGGTAPGPQGPVGRRRGARRGRGRVGEGSRASQYHLACASHPRRRSPSSAIPAMHSQRQRVRAGPQRLRRRRVARLSLPWSRRPRSGARPLLRPQRQAAAPPLPVPLPLRQMDSGSPAPYYGESGRTDAPHFPSQSALSAWRAGDQRSVPVYRLCSLFPLDLRAT